MYTPLPWSLSDDFEQGMTAILLSNTHQYVNCLFGAIERMNTKTQRKFLPYFLINMVNWQWSESCCPLCYQVYLVTTMNIISGNR